MQPDELGLKRCSREDLVGGDSETNAAIIKELLHGRKGPRRDIVALNAAAAIVAGGLADDLPTGIRLAEKSIDTGKAREKLEALIDLTN